jgi:hypothetical protein
VAASTGLRPVDALLEQDAHQRDRRWSIGAATTVLPDIECVLSQGSIEALDRARVAGKTWFHESSTVRERNAGLLVYALAIAASLDRFGRSLTTQPQEEIDQLLSGVAPCVVPEWRAMIDRAIARHGGASR